MPHVGRLAAAVLLAVAVPHPAMAQDSSVAVTNAEILSPIAMGNEADMDFGDITPSVSTGGTVVMSPSASATCTPSAGLLRVGTCRAAEFRGDAYWLFLLRITRPAGDQITLVGPGGATMLLDTFTFGQGSGLTTFANGNGPPDQQRYRVISFNGEFTFYIGGTLHVAANQQPGVYNGTFEITMNYD